MFTTQLKYQDPSNPMESYELAAQLAQFSSVSELVQINKAMELQQTYLSSINNAQMIGTIGKEVIGREDTILLKDGQTTKGSYKLNDAATAVTVKIIDEDGNVVRTIQSEQPQEAGSYDISWDGLDDSGEAAPNGSYHFVVEAAGADGNAMEVETTVSGLVTAFRVESGIPYLILGGSDGIKLPISSVMEVHEPVEAAA
jgi:flagellar basal-body rod modification protein FlgD